MKNNKIMKNLRDGIAVVAVSTMIGAPFGYFWAKNDPYNKWIEKIQDAPTIEARIDSNNKLWDKYMGENMLHGQPTYHAFLDEIKKRNEGNIISYNNDHFDFKKQPINFPDVDGNGKAGDEYRVFPKVNRNGKGGLYKND
jgi:hypothetical protein